MNKKIAKSLLILSIAVCPILKNCGSASSTSDEPGKTKLPNTGQLSILEIKPNFGAASGGSSVKIIGTSFSAQSSAFIGDQPCKNTVFISSGELDCETPKGDAGKIDVKVISQGETTTASKGFEYELFPISQSDKAHYFNSPQGMMMDGDNNLFVADRYNNVIKKFDSSSKLLMTIDGNVSGDGQFQYPNAVAVDGWAIYVADTGNNRVQKFSTSGSYQLTITGQGTTSGKFEYVKDVAVDINRNVLILDGDFVHKFNNLGAHLDSAVQGCTGASSIATDKLGSVYVACPDSIYVFGSDLEFNYKLSSAFPFELDLNYPQDIAFDPTGTILYIADTNNNTVKSVVITGMIAFPLISFSYVDIFGSTISPKSVAVSPTNYVYVADESYGQIYKFTNGGTYVRDIRTDTANGYLHVPNDVVTDSQGNVYVGDRGNHRIQKFDSAGRYLLNFGVEGTGSGQFSYIRNLAVDHEDNIFVSDSENDTVQKFDPTGKFLKTIGSHGTSNGQFVTPRGLAFDKNGILYVADSGNKRIQKFKSTGEFISTIESGRSVFGSIAGLTVDSVGNIFAVDTSYDTVYKIDATGVLVKSFGSNGTQNGQFRNPRDIAIDSNDQLYVVDSENNRIQKFDTNGAYQSMFMAGWYAYEGIFIDENDSVFVVNKYDHVVQKYDSLGNIIDNKL